MTPDFQIITQRLQLRLITADETNDLVERIRQSQSLHHWVDWCHALFSVQEAEQFIQATRLNWVKAEAYGFGVFERETQTLVGMMAINEFYHTFNMASLGYWIADDYQRRGYGKEALTALILFCFERLELTRLEIVCDPDNVPSQALALRCGAVQEQVAPNRFLYAGEPKAGIVFSLIP
ncbi:GNAT family N-acetyltransferase [Vibrio mimicus]|uniref:GNAT family N-acetyltransferase n=1 Tax=Vibrio mimicus TaxID=674 RepID=UPI00076B66BA|nr:GNAT family N-acetyltransferase [Vibrio mimicus]AMG04857.1 N-acetyltransferase [Vibrio mimicus]KAA3492039.1 GNAT family N-acetyltransferase [Vibrio mimicus]